MKHTLAILSTLSLALVAGACDERGAWGQGSSDLPERASLQDVGVDEGPEWVFWGGVFTPGTPIDVARGELGGDFGDRARATVMEAEVAGYQDGPWTEVTILVDGDDGASMAIFEVWGGLAGLPSGTTRIYDRWDVRDGGAYVSVIGCVGSDPYVWDRDDPAEQVRVTVSEAPDEPGMRIYEFTANFSAAPGRGSATTELSGRFRAR